MRSLPFIAAAALLGAALPALAAPASVTVSVGPRLQEKARTDLGVREVDRLADDLRTEVQRQTSRTGVLDGARIELTLVDAMPNRPTFEQMARRPGLSMSSFGIGGARIEGRAVAPDGTVTPLRFAWYETDIRYTPYRVTWSDAHTAMERFARRLARGQAVASR